MIDVHTAETPNGLKVPITLEDRGAPWRIALIHLCANRHKQPEFMRLNPNGRVPAIVDPHGPHKQPMSAFEPGAGLHQLADQYPGQMPCTEAPNWQPGHAR